MWCSACVNVNYAQALKFFHKIAITKSGTIQQSPPPKNHTPLFILSMVFPLHLLVLVYLRAAKPHVVIITAPHMYIRHNYIHKIHPKKNRRSRRIKFISMSWPICGPLFLVCVTMPILLMLYVACVVSLAERSLS